MTEVNRLKQIYPLAKIWIIPLVIFSVVLFGNWIANLIIFTGICIFALVGESLKDLIKSLSSVILVLCITIFIMQLLFFKQGGEHYFNIGMFAITQNGVDNALRMSTNILTMAASFLAFFKVTKEEDFINSLESHGLNYKACFVLSSTLQMIPQMKEYSKTIMDAQRARGIETEGNLLIRMKALVPNLGPLVLASIASSDERAITLETRGFSVECKKTKLIDTQKSPYDRILKIIWILLFIIVIAVKIWNVMR